MGTIKQNPDKPIEPEILADAIVKASDSMQKLLKSGLNRRAIVILVSADTNLARRDIERVLSSLEGLAVIYCKKS